MRIVSAEDSDRNRWNAFVAEHPEATFFHRYEWADIIRKAFGHPIHYLLAEGEEGRVTGLLPLVRIKSWLFGDTLSSVPFLPYAGAVAVDEATRRALEDAAVRLAEDLQVGSLELRLRAPSGRGWPTKDLYVNFEKPVSADHDENLKAIPRKQRAMVRKAIKAGLAYRIDEDLDDFFEMYTRSLHALGTPAFPRRFFQIIRETFPEESEILTVTHEGRPVASVLSYYFRDRVMPYYGGGVRQARALKANDFMYWSLMCHAVETRGVRVFDYGRSKKGTGSYSFKKNWGFEPTPLHYEYHLVRDQAMPDVNPANPKYRLFIQLWQRLPYPATLALGPHLVKYLG